MTDQNLELDRVFSHIGKATKADPVKDMPLGAYARECERCSNELAVAPPPTAYADRGLRLVRDLLVRAGDLARGIDNDPRRHLQIASFNMSEREMRAEVDRIWSMHRGRR